MPAVGHGPVRVEGLRELQRAFKRADTDLSRELRTTLRAAAEPVRVDAERLATAGIPRIGLPWSRMRVGVTQSVVYIAPKRRGARVGPKRPNLAGLLLERAMLPAIEQNESRVIFAVEQMLEHVGQQWERP